MGVVGLSEGEVLHVNVHRRGLDQGVDSEIIALVTPVVTEELA